MESRDGVRRQDSVVFAEVEKFRLELAQMQRQYFHNRQEKAQLTAARKNPELKNEMQKLREAFAKERTEYLNSKKATLTSKRGRLSLMPGRRKQAEKGGMLVTAQPLGTAR